MANGDTGLGTGGERRVSPRCSVVDAHLVPVDLAFQRAALLLDLSETGMGVQALVAHPRTGTTTELHFQLPESNVPVSGTGTVTWKDDSGRLGIRFDEIAEMCRPQLARWLSREGRSPVAPGPARRVAGQNEILLLRRDLLAQNIQGDEALAFVLERTRSVTGATGAAIALEEAGAFLCRVSSGAAPAVGAVLNPSSGLSGECLSTREVVRCNDTETDARVDRVVCRALHLRSAVIVPVKSKDRLIGVLEVFSSHAQAFKSSDVLMLREAADLIVELQRGRTAGVATDPVPAPIAEESDAEAARVITAAEANAGLISPTAPVTVETSAALAAPAPSETSAVMIDWSGLMYEREAPPKFADRVAALPQRLKFLLATLALTMLAGSGWAGWHWGQLASILHRPAPSQTVTAPAPTAAAVFSDNNVAQVSAPIANTSAPAAALPGPPASPPRTASAPKKKVAALVLPGPAPLVETQAPEPPPAIAPPANGTVEAAGLSEVLSAAAAPASLAPAPSSAGVSGGKLIRKVEPVYPSAARSLRVKGTVVLKASVDVHGRVGNVGLISGNAMLAVAAVNAVKNWRYQPFLLNGVPVPTDVTVKVNFAPKD